MQVGPGGWSCVDIETMYSSVCDNGHVHKVHSLVYVVEIYTSHRWVCRCVVWLYNQCVDHTRFRSVWMSYAYGVRVSYVCVSTMHSGDGDVVVNEYA